jgi:hypothetical protein
VDGETHYADEQAKGMGNLEEVVVWQQVKAGDAGSVEYRALEEYVWPGPEELLVVDRCLLEEPIHQQKHFHEAWLTVHLPGFPRQ